MNGFIKSIIDLFSKKEIATGIGRETQHEKNLVKDQTGSKGVYSHAESHSLSQTNYLAFDLEIAKSIPGDFNQWKVHRPLGISCAATILENKPPSLWYSRREDGSIAEKMSREDVCKLVEYLERAANEGCRILTWNGLGFDFDVLAEESGRWETCRNLALNHFDMMFHLLCLQGYPLSLDKAAKGMGLSGKKEGMTGDLAPILWQQGKYDQVLEYVAQDVRTTLEVAKVVLQKKKIYWVSNSGNYQHVNLSHGWLIVNQAMKLPLPDTSWMTKPLKRSDFYQWISDSEESLPLIKTVNIPIKRTTIPVDQRSTFNPKNRSQELLSEEKINFKLANCDSVIIDIPHDGEDIESPNSQGELARVLECQCSICRGSPNRDPVFLICEERNEDYYDDYDELAWYY